MSAHCLCLSGLPNSLIKSVQDPLLVCAPLRCDQQALGSVSRDPVHDSLRRQKAQAVDDQITIGIQCKQRERICLVLTGQFGPF